MTRTCPEPPVPGLKSAPLPRNVAPMLASPGSLPKDQDAFGFEFKWDGIRAICRCSRTGLRLQSRNLLDITPQYPEVQGLHRQLDRRTALLDGEIIALDAQGRPSFNLLQQRMHVSHVTGQLRKISVTYMLFDILYLDGYLLTELPYEQRRALLEQLELTNCCWQTPPWHRGGGDRVLAAATHSGLEGVVAKRLTSRYEPGRRSREWLKVKVTQRQEFVIGGWVPGEGAHRGLIGSLLAGYYSQPPAKGKPGRLHFAGGVGTGFKAADHRQLLALLRKRERPTSPFVDKVPRKGAIWVEPDLVVEVAFFEWTPAGLVRHPSYQGLRSDKPAHEVVRERPVNV